jgi:hypothetical protein
MNLRHDELIFFLQSEPKKTKQMLLQQRNQLMENILQTDAEIGGRIIRKQQEPLSEPVESALIQEMRLMHLDFVEESYWKRCAAKQFAVDCSIVALHKAKLKAAKQSRN